MTHITNKCMMGSTKKTVIKFTSKWGCFEYLSTATNSNTSEETLLSDLKNGFVKFLKFLPTILKNITQIQMLWTFIKTYVFFR